MKYGNICVVHLSLRE